MSGGLARLGLIYLTQACYLGVECEPCHQQPPWRRRILCTNPIQMWPSCFFFFFFFVFWPSSLLFTFFERSGGNVKKQQEGQIWNGLTLHMTISEIIGLQLILQHGIAISILRPRQNGHHFAAAKLKCIFSYEKCSIFILILLKCVPKDPINNDSVLVQIIAGYQTGDKLLSEPMV